MILLKLKQQNVEIKISLIRAKCTILLGSNCQRADAAWSRVKVDPGSTHALITLVGLDFSAVLRAAIFISNVLNYLPQPNLSVRILCEVSFQLSVSYDLLSCTSHHDDQTGN